MCAEVLLGPLYLVNVKRGSYVLCSSPFLALLIIM